jgi:hypothetical protein
MIVVGGDTFNESAYSADTDYLEGEVATEKALEYMGEFNPIKIWASKGNLNERNIRRAINEGAGFLYFCGHGNPATWATHPHGDFDTWIGYYRNWNIFFLRNNGKFPILMVGGCHNSQFNVTPLNLLKNPIDAIYKSNWVLECWSWRFVSKIGGGAIASIGSTGYGGVEIGDFNQNGVPDCIEGADGWFETHFFKLYAQEKNILGELWGQTVTDYISNFPVMDNRYDCKIVECHTLLGDPSLKIGGYPS